MTNSDILSFIDENIYSNPATLIRGNVLNEALTNMATMDIRPGGVITDGQNSPLDGVPSVDFNARVLLDQNGDVSVDYSYGGSYSRSLRSSDGNVVLAWDAQQVFDYNGILSIDWTNRYLSDSNNVYAIVYESGARLLIDSANNVSVDYSNRFIYDATGSVISLDYGDRYLYDTSQTLSIDYGNRYMYDTGGEISVDFKDKQLDSSGLTNLDWSNCLLIYGGNTVYNWANNSIYDSSTAKSIDANNRYLLDSSGAPSIDYNSRFSYDSSSIYSIDWSGRCLLDIYATTCIDWNDGQFYSLQYRSTDVAKWGVNPATSTLQFQIQESSYLSFVDYNPSTFLTPTTQTASISKGYGNINTGIMGCPSLWIPIQIGAAIYQLPLY